MIIILYGLNAVGKSTTARDLAGRMKRAAYVEADLLKYMIAGGLVAWSAGQRPSENREEHRAQIALKNRNTALLAGSFDDAGFDCVIEGLHITEGPGTGWIEEHLDGHEVRCVALVCDPEIVMARRLERDGVTGNADEYAEWRKTAMLSESGFDYVVDTSVLPVHACVSACAEALGIEVTESATAMGVDWEVIKGT